MLTEILALGNPATADAIMRAVGLVRVEQHGSLTVSEVAKHLKTYSPDKMRQVLARLRDLYPRSIRYFGGAMADIAHRTDPKANVRIGIEDMIVGRWEKHKAKIDAIISGQPYISDPIFTEDLARVIVGLVESSKVDPERIFDEALVHKPDPGTATYQWLCASGFLTNTEFVNAFCR